MCLISKNPPSVQGPFWCASGYTSGKLPGASGFPTKRRWREHVPSPRPPSHPFWVISHIWRYRFRCASGVLPVCFREICWISSARNFRCTHATQLRKKPLCARTLGRNTCASGYTSGKLPGASGSSNKTKMFVDDSSKRVLPTTWPRCRVFFNLTYTHTHTHTHTHTPMHWWLVAKV